MRPALGLLGLVAGTARVGSAGDAGTTHGLQPRVHARRPGLVGVPIGGDPLPTLRDGRLAFGAATSMS